MRAALSLPRSLLAGAAAFLPLAGCVVDPPSGVTSGLQARVITATPSCRPPFSTPASTGNDVDVLKAAFARVRTGTLLQTAETKQGSIELATLEKVGAPILRVDAATLVEHGAAQMGALPQTNNKLQTAQAALAAKSSPPARAAQSAANAGAASETVAQELARRIPWLSDSSVAYVAQPGGQQVAEGGLELISFVVEKKATLLTADPNGRTTLFGPGDSQKMLPSLQQFAGFEPFRLVTLLAAQQIIEYLASQGAEHKETPQLIALVAIFNAADFLATYFDEYLRGGQFVQVSLNQQSLENDMIQQFDSKLKVPLTDDAKVQLRQTVNQICAKAQGHCTALSTLGSDGFTSLFGQSVQFAGVSVAFNGTTPNAPWRPSVSAPSVGVFGPQMVQVLIEASFDANGPHPPGLSTSTACTKGLFQAEDDPHEAQCVDTGKIGADWSRINTVGNAIQALITTGVGAVIRGGNVAALNNETIATVVETLAGVATRKAVQQVMWVCAVPASARVDPQGVKP